LNALEAYSDRINPEKAESVVFDLTNNNELQFNYVLNHDGTVDTDKLFPERTEDRLYTSIQGTISNNKDRQATED
jgi:hypothetical protein